MSTSIQSNAPFRADIVGSFLRPQAVKDARAAYAAGTLDAEGLKAVEDEAIRDLVAKQKAAGLQVITDGEFRRSYWHLDFMWGLNGIERRTSRTGYMFHDEETTADTAVVTGPIGGKNHPFVEHFKFVKALEGEGQVARQTIPAPIQTFSEVTLDRCDGQQESLRAVYKTDEELADAIAAAYRTVIADLYAAGCRNIQFDDCTWGIYCDTDFVAPYLFAHEDVDAFYLEFDTPRAGGFEPLKYVAPGKKVVLGLVTTKAAELEDEDAIVERIHEAAKYVPLVNLYLSPQCGFASCEIGNKLTEDEQWAKIALVKRISERVWK